MPGLPGRPVTPAPKVPAYPVDPEILAKIRVELTKNISYPELTAEAYGGREIIRNVLRSRGLPEDYITIILPSLLSRFVIVPPTVEIM